MGVVSAVSIDRDARGVPTVVAANEVDLAYGMGFAHGQDRFFQMDLSRRLAAGELAELIGAPAVQQDKKARLFQFRHVARQALQQGTPEQRAVLEAYTRGVNAGLGSLRSRPWEYWVLGSAPLPWRAEDTILVSYAMWWDLQYPEIDREILRQQINARLRGPECAAGWKCSLQFMYPARTEWDAPNAQTGLVNVVADAAIPPPDVLNVRGADTPAALLPALSSNTGIGSNNWAIAGRLTATGAALIANDMHLRARVPVVWYRARMRVTASDTQPAVDLTGVTLAGAPILVAGSNGHIAWGFTNSYGNWFHVERSACTAVTSVQQEEIRVHNQPSVIFSVKSNSAGVLYRTDTDAGCWFVSWLAQRPAATNMSMMALERATSVTQALAIAPTLGIPHQNFVVGDREGHIAWSIAGRIPADDGPARVIDHSGWTTSETHPHIVDPEAGRIWTANSRPTDDPAQEAAIAGVDASVGAFYDLGARAHQIRDDLLAIEGPATPADMLRIQLDDRAVFLSRWRTLLLDLLDTDALTGHPQREEFKRLILDWNSRASVDAVGYRLVRAYHERTTQTVWAMVLGALGMASAEPRTGESLPAPAQFESGLWRLVNERPMHMLASRYVDWRQFLLVEVDATIEDLHQKCSSLSSCTWGSRTPVHIQHPLSRALSFLSRLLDMPEVQLPGDHDLPRVQDGAIGASERFAVSPGHEDQGYIHLPGGQSGHPLSPYYRAGFTDWAQGLPTPFLPGPSQHRLMLQSE